MGMVCTEVFPKVTPGRGGGESVGGVVVCLSVSSSSESSASDCGSVAKGEKGLLVKSGLEDCDAAERSSHPSATSCVDGEGSWESGGLAMEGKYSVMGLDP